MKLYWSPRSPFARKVMVFAHEAGLAGRIEQVQTHVAMTQPNRELMRVNPLGKIPVLITDQGMVLFDSTVICEYLDSLHDGPKLFPREPDQRWQALRWHALGNGMLDTLVLWRNERIRPKPQQSPEVLAGFELKTGTCLELLNNEAAALGAASLAIGHVAIAVALGYLDFRFPELGWRDGHGRIAAWYESFAQRPSIRNTLPVDA
ncbi:MAG: glutathione S-transferase [Betaproteobacteria bacterium]|nr:glutathione S-transferase [Betaproteobacteria bacterium]